jgi:hypothetical protein
VAPAPAAASKTPAAKRPKAAAVPKASASPESSVAAPQLSTEEQAAYEAALQENERLRLEIERRRGGG